MNQFENMFKLDYTSHWKPCKNKIFTIEDGKYMFNYCLFLYIDHYKHLTNIKKDLSKIKDIGIKIANKFNGYLYYYNDKNEMLHINLMTDIRNSVDIIDPIIDMWGIKQY